MHLMMVNMNKVAAFHCLLFLSLSVAPCVLGNPFNINLAATAAASASSTEVGTPACENADSCSPDKAIDGDIFATRWAGLKPSPQRGPEWYSLAWLAEVDIDRLVLTWEAAYAKEYQVQTSDDGIAWDTVLTVTDGNGGVETINSLGISSKHLRLTFLERAQKRFGHSLWEVEVYGPTAPPGPTPTDPPTMSNAPSASLRPSPPPGSILVYQDPSKPVAERVTDLLDRMTLEEKIGQMTQVERKSLDSDDHITSYFLGSLLSGGGSTPDTNSAQAWAAMHDAYQEKALATRLGIPLIYGVDAVHGHSNVIGATIFPHNIGLGATRNASLVEEVGKITAKEVYATGIPWNFSPCLAVARDIRWGRTYESFGEHPEIATMMTSYIDGLQGTYDGGPGLGGVNTVLATPKHWVGDGGTTGGDDQGFTEMSEADLLDIHGTPYNKDDGAIFRFSKSGGTGGSIMPSYSSVNFLDDGTPGELKMHGHAHLINTVLREQMGFEGFIISDWMAIDQIPGDYYSDVKISINAGIDMVMVPHDYQTFKTTLNDVYNNDDITMARIDEAVSRILTAKFQLGLFEKPLADRDYISDVGSQAHRAVAQDAVSQSLVLLKNEPVGGTSVPFLPIDLSSTSSISKIVVAGKNADNIGHQCGGWTITWQGGSGATTIGTTVLDAITAEASSATNDVEVEFKGSRATGPISGDLGIVVIGETPYAEGNGDDNNLALNGEDGQAVQNVCSAMPCVVVLISGRPMMINTQLAQADAFVAAWLPGTEGAGVTDVLFGRTDFTGTLPMTWPSDMSQVPINVGDASYNPLFPYGYGCNMTTTCPTPVV